MKKNNECFNGIYHCKWFLR